MEKLKQIMIVITEKEKALISIARDLTGQVRNRIEADIKKEFNWEKWK